MTITANNLDETKPGTYEITYSVTDKDGNTTTVVRTITVSNPPVISGADDVSVNPNSTFDPNAGVTVTDVEDDASATDVTLTITGSVDTSIPGNYTLTYTATDSDGNKTIVTRVVTVTNAPTINGADDVTLHP